MADGFSIYIDQDVVLLVVSYLYEANQVDIMVADINSRGIRYYQSRWRISRATSNFTI